MQVTNIVKVIIHLISQRECQLQRLDSPNYSGHLILLQWEQGHGAVSIQPTAGTGQWSAAQAGQPGQNHTGPIATAGTATTANVNKLSKGLASQHHEAPSAHVIYIMPVDEEKLCALMNRHREDKEWLCNQGGAILRRILHMLREQSCEGQTDPMDDCLRRLTTGHKTATAAWICQAVGLTWDPETQWTTEYKRASKRLIEDYLTQWAQGIRQQPGVMGVPQQADWGHRPHIRSAVAGQPEQTATKSTEQRRE